MKFKILTLHDERLLLNFLLWLTPEALELWHYYGKIFDENKVRDILLDFTSVKIGGIEERKIIVFGHLYNFTKDSCRLGIVSGIIGKGYGTKMMDKLIKMAKQLGCKKICLSTYGDNCRAVDLYKRFGFMIVKEFTDRPREKYEMVLNL